MSLYRPPEGYPGGPPVEFKLGKHKGKKSPPEAPGIVKPISEKDRSDRLRLTEYLIDNLLREEQFPTLGILGENLLSEKELRGAKVLDVGADLGTLGEALKKRFGCVCTAVDLGEIRMDKRKAKEIYRGGVFPYTDVFSFLKTRPKEKYDFIFCLGARRIPLVDLVIACADHIEVGSKIIISTDVEERGFIEFASGSYARHPIYMEKGVRVIGMLPEDEYSPDQHVWVGEKQFEPGR